MISDTVDVTMFITDASDVGSKSGGGVFESYVDDIGLSGREFASS